MPSSDQPSGTFLGVGDVAYSGPPVSKANVAVDTSGDFFEVAKLPGLPGTKEEVMSVSEIIKGNNQLLLGRRATEAAFKSTPLERFRMIHLTVHGLADSNFPTGRHSS
jgi:CHAT domain-containing protein